MENFVSNFSFTPSVNGNQYTGVSYGEDLLRKWKGIDTSAIYQAQQLADERNYERKNIEDARSYEQFMDNTKYQRAFEDLRKAGVNPWLVVNGGSVGGSSYSSGVSTGGSARQKYEAKNKSSVGEEGTRLLGTLLGTALKLGMMLF